MTSSATPRPWPSAAPAAAMRSSSSTRAGKRRSTPAPRPRPPPPPGIPRPPGAVELLIGVRESADRPQARAALQAIALYRHDEQVRSRIAAAIEQRDDEPLRQTFRNVFGPP